jgi:hypothetical protein
MNSAQTVSLHEAACLRGASFCNSLINPLVYILLLSVGVIAVLGEWVDSSVIAGVVLFKAVLGLEPLDLEPNFHRNFH